MFIDRQRRDDFVWDWCRPTRWRSRLRVSRDVGLQRIGLRWVCLGILILSVQGCGLVFDLDAPDEASGITERSPDDASSFDASNGDASPQDASVIDAMAADAMSSMDAGRLPCESGWERCGDEADAMCINLLDDVNHCGGCGVLCSEAPDDGFPVCDMGVCAFDCASGLAPLGDGCGVAAIGVTAGEAFSCAVFSSGQVQCWGGSDYGQTGMFGTSAPRVVAGIVDAVQISAGRHHVCVRNRDGTVQCWGANQDGQLGAETTRCAGVDVPCSSTPMTVGRLPPVADISAGRNHTCAVLVSGQVYCWGSNEWGQLGDDGFLSRMRPEPVLASGGAPLANVIQVSTQQQHTCAVHDDGQVSCWGRNDYGAVGRDPGVDCSTVAGACPIAAYVSGISTAAQVACSFNHTCVTLDDHSVQCWGNNTYGSLGDGTTSHRPTPAPVTGLTNVRMVSNGTQFSCVVTLDGLVACWGRNSHGQMGNGSVSVTESELTPTWISSIDEAIGVSVSMKFGCALLRDNLVRCWGMNNVFQLGRSTSRCERDGAESIPCSLVPIDVDFAPL